MYNFNRLIRTILETRRSDNETVRGLNIFLSQINKTFPDIPSDMLLDVKDFIDASRCPEIVFEPLHGGALGISLSDKCVISTSALGRTLYHALYVVFHEVAHQYQYSKHGEKFVQDLYNDQMSIEDAAELLIKVELTADRYAINKVKQLYAKYMPNTRIILHSLYKNAGKQFIATHLQQVRDMAKSSGLTDIEDINQMIYNTVKADLVDTTK